MNTAICINCGKHVNTADPELLLHNWSKSNNCDPEDPEGPVAEVEGRS